MVELNNFLKYILDIHPLSNVWFANIFSHFGLSFIFVEHLLGRNILVQWSLACFFVFVDCASGTISKKLFQRPMSKNFFPAFSFPQEVLWFLVLHLSF